MSNNSSLIADSSWEEHLFCHVFLCFIFISSIIGNLILIVSLIIRPGVLNFVDKLMLNSVMCNILLVFFSIPPTLVQEEADYHIYDEVICKLVYPASTYFMNAGVFTYVAIAFERYSVVSSVHDTRPTKRQMVIVFLAIHLCAIATVIPYVETSYLSSEYECKEAWNSTSKRFYSLSLFIIQYGVPVPFMFVFYTKTWLIVNKSNRWIISSLLERGNTPKQKPCQGSFLTVDSTTNNKCMSTTSLLPGNDSEESENVNHTNVRSMSTSFIAESCHSREFCEKSLRVSLLSRTQDDHVTDLGGEKERRKRASTVNSCQSGTRKISFSKRYFSSRLKVRNDSLQIVAVKRRFRQSRKLLIRFTAIMSVFTICMLPYHIYWLLVDFYYDNNEFFSKPVWNVVYMVTYTNCVINPWIYGKYDKRFRSNIQRKNKYIKKKILTLMGSILKQNN